jgi:hypothetical protein
MLTIHLRLGLPSGLFPSGFLANNLYKFLFSLIRATCPVTEKKSSPASLQLQYSKQQPQIESAAKSL